MYKAIIGLFLTVIFHSSFSWNALGHMLIAKIAYDRLNSNVREKVDDLAGYFHQEYPDMKDYVEQSTWPDELRKQKIETYTHWHYVDFAFSGDGTRLKNLLDTDNALWAMKLIKPVLMHEKTNHFERARFLAFLTHIVGDLHQPLHTVSRISAELREGDEGGNLFFLDAYKSSNLHALWDNGVGYLQGKSTKELENLARELTTTYPDSFFHGEAEDLDEANWAAEGMRSAVSMVYNISEFQQPNDIYHEKGQTLAKQRIVLAGYRLGYLLNSLLG